MLLSTGLQILLLISRLWYPVPQFLLQEPHLPRLDQPPCTLVKRKQVKRGLKTCGHKMNGTSSYLRQPMLRNTNEILCHMIQTAAKLSSSLLVSIAVFIALELLTNCK